MTKSILKYEVQLSDCIPFSYNFGFWLFLVMANNLAFSLTKTVFQCCPGDNLLFWCVSQPVHCCHTNLSIGKPSGNLFETLPQSRCTTHESMIWANMASLQPHQWSEALACSPVLGVDVARKWHHIKNKKQICLCLSRLPGIKRLSFQHLVLRGLTQWHSDCSHSSMPRLLGRVYTTPAFWPDIPWKNEFPPQCTTMLREARARARACCDVNLMTSRCSDGRSKQPNKGIVVFLLHFVGKGPLCLSYSSLLVTKQWRVCGDSGV